LLLLYHLPVERCRVHRGNWGCDSLNSSHFSSYHDRIHRVNSDVRRQRFARSVSCHEAPQPRTAPVTSYATWPSSREV